MSWITESSFQLMDAPIINLKILVILRVHSVHLSISTTCRKQRCNKELGEPECLYSKKKVEFLSKRAFLYSTSVSKLRAMTN